MRNICFKKYSMIKKFLVLLGMFCFIICSSKNAKAGDYGVSQGSNESKENHNKLALLVGIDDYISVKVRDLKGCVNDVKDLKQLLINNFGFANNNILTLTNKEATHKGIISAFRKHLIQKATAGTIVVFHYSGHGSQMKDAEGGDEEYDHKDETIVPHDSRTPGKFDIRDDELNGLFTELTKKTKHVTFILDSCHSGSGIRGTGVPRRVSEDLRKPPPDAPWEISTRGTAGFDSRFENLNYVLISGCQAEEVSFETRKNGVPRGVFTYYLVKEIREALKEGITYQDVMDQVKADVSRDNNTQHPQIEGKLINNYVFSDKTSVPAPFVLASFRKNSVILEAGQVHGATSGSRYYVYRPSTKQFDDPEEAIAEIELTKVKPFSSEAKIIKFIKGKKPRDILQASRAVEYEHAYEIEKFPIYFLQPEDSETLKKIRAEVGKVPHYNIVKNRNEARMMLAEVQEDIKIYRSSGQEVVGSAVRINEPDAPEKVMDKLEHWAKWYNILSVENHKSKSLKVELEVRGVTREGKKDVTETSKVPTQQFYHEDEIKFIVKNRGNKKFFFVIIDISSDGSIALAYPESGDGEALFPGKKVEIKDMEAFVADNYQEVVDIIKVIATDKQVNFKFLEMDASYAKGLRGMEDPLTRLLKGAALQSPATRGTRKKNLNDWVTTECVFKVVRKQE